MQCAINQGLCQLTALIEVLSFSVIVFLLLVPLVCILKTQTSIAFNWGYTQETSTALNESIQHCSHTQTHTPPTCSLWFFTIHNWHLRCHTTPSSSNLLVFGFFYYLKGRMTLSTFPKCKKWMTRGQRNPQVLLGFPKSLLALKVTTTLLAEEKVVILPLV